MGIATLTTPRLRPSAAGPGAGSRVVVSTRAVVSTTPQSSSSFRRAKPPGARLTSRARWGLGADALIRPGVAGGQPYRALRSRALRVRAHSDPHGHSHSRGVGRPSFTDGDGSPSAHAHSHSHEHHEHPSGDGSFDEEAFVSEAGIGVSCCASQTTRCASRGPNLAERALTWFYRATRLGWIADTLRGNATLCAVSWFFLVVGGVAHVCRHFGADSAAAATAEATATAAVYALSGTSQFVDVSYEMAVGNISIHVLTTLAVVGTVVLGCALEGALLLVLFQTAHFVETRLTGHARGDLRSLWATVPGEANVVDLNPDGSPDVASERLVPAREVAVGTNVFVKAGQQVPLDGVVVHGSALVSIQHITGEALPVTKRVGDEVPAGAVNNDGALVVRSLRSAEDSTPARIARLTEAAQNRRPTVSRLLDTFGDRYSKAILAVTALTMVVGPLALGWPLMGRGGAMYRAFAFLSAAAPCALLMAPLVYVAAVGACARRGVLVRGGVTFDTLAECGVVALDKTGTITTGRMMCSSVERAYPETPIPAVVGAANADSNADSNATETSNQSARSTANAMASSPTSNPTALAIAASLERGATHPIARATLDAAASASASGASPLVAVSDFKVVHGYGVEGLVRPGVGGVECGPPRLARFGSVEWACEIAGTPERADALRRAAAVASDRGGDVAAALVVEDVDVPFPSSDEFCDVEAYDPEAWRSENLACVFRFADSPHPKAAAAVSTLREGAWRGGEGMRLLMLTGDNPESAAAIARDVGLPAEDVNAGLTPGDKLRIVERTRAEAAADSSMRCKKVAMVGDGINDAPALAAADVGVAVASTPSEAAAAAADVLLLHADADGISQLPELFDLAARTRAVLRQNITLAVVSIVGASLPALVGAFPLWLAVLLHEGSTLLVAINSIRLLGTFGRQPLRRSTLFATLAVFAACCLGGAWLYPTVRASTTAAAAAFVATPAFISAGLALKSAWAGLLAGCLHTLTGPDHLAALTPLSVGPSRAQNALMGALWGCGHNTGQILFGIIFVLLKDRLPFNMEIIGQWGQGIVGATLVIIGIMGWWEAKEMAAGRGHSHSHSHSLPFGMGKGVFGDGHAHAHSHAHSHAHAEGAGSDDAHSHSSGHASEDHDGHHGMGSTRKSVDGPWEAKGAEAGSGASAEAEEARRRQDGSFLSWTYITGTIHGLQPDALLMLLPAFALPRMQAIAFLGTFFVGTIVAMGTYTACLGAGTSALQKHNPQAVSVVSRVSSAVAVAFGVAFILSAVFGFEIF